MVLGQEAASALSAWRTAGEREAGKRAGGSPQLSRTKDDQKGWFVFTFSLTEECKPELIIPPQPLHLPESGKTGMYLRSPALCLGAQTHSGICSYVLMLPTHFLSTPLMNVAFISP